MAELSVAERTFLEDVLEMSGGYVLDFSDGTFANFFSSFGIDVYDTELFPGFGGSKANRMRAFWRHGLEDSVSQVLSGLADYMETKKALANSRTTATSDQVERMRHIAGRLRQGVGPAAPFTMSSIPPVAMLQIDLHPDIASHVQPYLDRGDWFHAVEEAYKVVREKLRDLTGSEKATDAFTQSGQSDKFHPLLFGDIAPSGSPQADYRRGTAYLHLAVQFFRNAMSHSKASELDPTSATQFLSLASLSYDLITRYVDPDTVTMIDEAVRNKRASYRSAAAFYKDYEDHRWLTTFAPIPALEATSVRMHLKSKWLADADFTVSYTHSNIMFMRLELVVDQLTGEDLDSLLQLPTKDTYGNDQMAGLKPFLEYVTRSGPAEAAARAKAHSVKLAADADDSASS